MVILVHTMQPGNTRNKHARHWYVARDDASGTLAQLVRPEGTLTRCAHMTVCVTWGGEERARGWENACLDSLSVVV